MTGFAAIRPSQSRINALARGILRLRSLTGTEGYSRFVIVGIARTGSTLLVNLLNAHSQVLAFGEIFRSPDRIGWDTPPFNTARSPKALALYRTDPLAFLEQSVFRRWPKAYGAVGFKLFYYHARQPPHSLVWDYLAADPRMRILHIKRRNTLKQYYSLQLAHKTDVWVSTGARTRDPPPLRLDVEACRAHFASVRRMEGECDTFFKARQTKDIYYEDLAASCDREMEGVQEFLELRRERVSARIVRQRTTSLSQAIANYGELKNAFACTQWQEFFDDPSD